MNSLDELFDHVSAELKEGKTLSSLAPVLARYSGSDWKRYKLFSRSHYTRNVVRLNEILEMVVICWEVNQSCPVHDHPEGGCLVRLLQGEIRENTYQLDSPPRLMGSRMLTINDIAYQERGFTGHEITNNSGYRAVSLHLYSPSNYKPTFY